MLHVGIYISVDVTCWYVSYVDVHVTCWYLSCLCLHLNCPDHPFYKRAQRNKLFYTMNGMYYHFWSCILYRSETWYYTCVNVYSEVLTLYPSGTEHRLDKVQVFSLNDDLDGYVDSIFIGQAITTDDPGIFTSTIIYKTKCIMGYLKDNQYFPSNTGIISIFFGKRKHLYFVTVGFDSLCDTRTSFILTFKSS